MTQMYKTFFKAQNILTKILKIKKGALPYPQTELNQNRLLMADFCNTPQLLYLPKILLGNE